MHDHYTDPLYLTCVVLWIALWAYWLASMRGQKAQKATESRGERLQQILPMVVVYTLLFSPAASIGWLGRRLWAESMAIERVGVAIAAFGIAFAIWARHHLGANWSARVSIRADHELIRTGPYRAIRHPIYTGMLLGAFGTAIVIGEVRGLVALAVMATAFYFKASKEERWLAREFGPRFDEHRKHTGMFLPGI
ncbi:MAG TPA: isoprenylcysteine carboxylmethyltransferase family protein [Vicinamibacterales bacterium]|nr:isoprenylcysteine carboxylmethyltransferase family protein [Vicinamibacterales bacterium]